MIKNIYDRAISFFNEHGISVNLSRDMPAGYETAFGTYDIEKNTLFINDLFIGNVSEPEYLFYLYHELRHAEQYLQPDKFDEKIRKSLQYVILYNGTCFRFSDGRWHECFIDDGKEFLSDAYKGLPYETDANDFAYETVLKICGESPELKKVYFCFKPEKQLTDKQYAVLFRRIDRLTGFLESSFSEQ